MGTAIIGLCEAHYAQGLASPKVRSSEQRYGHQLVPSGSFDRLKRPGAGKLVAISFSLDRVISERVFGIQQGLVHGVAHRADPGDVREDDSIGPILAIDQSWVSNQ